MTEQSKNSESLREALEAFVLDRDALSSIRDKFVGFNVFEAIGHTHAEEKHSNFLAFLLDPRGSHGFGDAVLKELVIRSLSSISRESRPIDLVQFSLADMSSTLVLREHRSIDIFGVNDEESIVLVIENKIRSTEHSDQLRRYRQYVEGQYPNHKKVFIYLTPEGEEPSDSAYIPLSYFEILGLVGDLTKEYGQSLAEPVLYTLENYLEVLRRYVVADEELIDLAKSIYQKHKLALDFIFEQRPDLQSDLSDLFQELIAETGGFNQDRGGKTYINFAPNEWEHVSRFNITPTNQWTRTGRNLLFEFRNHQRVVNLCLVLGPAEEQETRQEIFEYCKSKPEIFKGISSKLYQQYVTLHSKKLLTKAQLEDGEISELEPKIRKAWNDFLEGDLPKIREALEERFT